MDKKKEAHEMLQLLLPNLTSNLVWNEKVTPLPQLSTILDSTICTSTDNLKKADGMSDI